MNKVRRTRGIRRIIRNRILKEAITNYVTAGDRACQTLKREPRLRRQASGPSDSAILAWAKFDLNREILGGFWEIKAA